MMGRSPVATTSVGANVSIIASTVDRWYSAIAVAEHATMRAGLGSVGGSLVSAPVTGMHTTSPHHHAVTGWMGERRPVSMQPEKFA
jgi:hypothetical protein